MSEPEWAMSQQKQGGCVDAASAACYDDGVYGAEQLSKEYEIQNLAEVLDALSKADCTMFNKSVQVNPAIVQAYLDKESKLLTREQRICLEYMHPEIVNINPLPGLVASVALNCEVVVYTQEYDYRNQDIEDSIAYLIKVGDDTVVTREALLGDGECSFTLSALPDAEAEKYERSKQAEKEPTVPTLNAVTIKKKPDPVKPGQQEKGVFTCWSKLTKSENMCFWFTGFMQSWPQGINWREAISQKRMFTARLLGSVFTEHIVPAFGITNVPVWKDLATNVLSNTPMWIQVTTDKARTSMLRCNLATPIEHQEIPNVAVSTDGFIADFARALEEEIGLPITAATAASIMTDTKCCGQNIICKVPEESEVKAAHPAFVPSFVCLSEQPAAFASTVAAKCKFFALNPVFCRSQFKVRDISPEIGSALMSADWYTKKDFVLAESRTVMTAADPLRSSISDAATKSLFLPLSNRTTYVYALRTKDDRRSSVDRLFAALKVFKHGGNYGDNGIPIIENKASILRIESGKPQQDTQAPAMVPPIRIDAPPQQKQAEHTETTSPSPRIPAQQPVAAPAAAASAAGIDDAMSGDDEEGGVSATPTPTSSTPSVAAQKKPISSSSRAAPRVPSKRKVPTGDHEDQTSEPRDAKRTKRVVSSSSSAQKSPTRKAT